jgi:hypothetical protein
MCSQARRIADSRTVQVPSVITLEVFPAAVVRSVLGHLAAQGVGRYQKGEITEPLRDFILDPSLPLPQSMRVYYWLYPYREQVLVRDAAMLQMGQRDVFAFWLMKFFPLAFFVTIGELSRPLYRMANFDACRSDAASARRSMPLVIRPLMNQHWPERPTDDRVLLYGPQAMVAEPLTRIVQP